MIATTVAVVIAVALGVLNAIWVLPIRTKELVIFVGLPLATGVGCYYWRLRTDDLARQRVTLAALYSAALSAMFLVLRLPVI